MPTLTDLNRQTAWQRNQWRLLGRRLRQAELLVVEGEKYVVHHRIIVDGLELSGQDAAQARLIMYAFERAHLRHIAERDRLLDKLSKL